MRSDIERVLQADRRAVIQQARALVEAVDDQLRAARLQRAMERPRIVYKTRQNAHAPATDCRAIRLEGNCLMAIPTVTEVNEALALALKVVEARGDQPIDPKIWRRLLVYAPYWVLMEAPLRIRRERHATRQAVKRERGQGAR